MLSDQMHALDTVVFDLSTVYATYERSDRLCPQHERHSPGSRDKQAAGGQELQRPQTAAHSGSRGSVPASVPLLGRRPRGRGAVAARRVWVGVGHRGGSGGPRWHGRPVSALPAVLAVVRAAAPGEPNKCARTPRPCLTAACRVHGGSAWGTASTAVGRQSGRFLPSAVGRLVGEAAVQCRARQSLTERCDLSHRSQVLWGRVTVP